jgi:hypothetical protein
VLLVALQGTPAIQRAMSRAGRAGSWRWAAKSEAVFEAGIAGAVQHTAVQHSCRFVTLDTVPVKQPRCCSCHPATGQG